VPIDYREPDWEGRARAAAGKGFDAAFDPIGGESFKRSFRLLEPGGLLVAYGFYRAVTGKGGSIPLDFLRLKLWDLLPNGRSTTFYSIGALRKQHPDWFIEDLTQLFDLLRAGRIQPKIAARMPLAEARKAHERIEQGGLQGKIVLDVAGSTG
jgi:NADPH:quinone reductase-like Zn-dependent oxidoreductase